MITKKRVIVSLIFYMIVLIWIISFKMNMEQPIFECMYYFGQFSILERLNMTFSVFDLSKLFDDWKDFLVNMCFFLPLGVYCYELIKKHKFIKGLMIAFLLSLVLELVQLLTTVGFFTINDLVSNTLGYVVGYFLYLLLNKLLKPKVMYYIFNIFTIFFIALATYGIINTIIHIEIYSLEYYK